MTTRVPALANRLRKQPQQARSRAMVDDILEAAARIVEEEGLSALSTNAVADLAGVSIGSLYQYFPNQVSLLAELTRRERLMLRAEIERVAMQTGQGTLDESLRALAHVAVRHQLHRPRLARALDFAEPTLDLDVETRALADDLARRVAGMLHAHGQPRAEEASRDIVALAKGMIDAAGLAGETDPDAIAARVLRAVLGYLGR